MDSANRMITKIAREAAKFTILSLKYDGIGSSEFDFIHAVRHNPGITQARICTLLGIDKGAAAKRAANLEAKGYILRAENPSDRRSRLLYPTPAAEALKVSKASAESTFYSWLFDGLPASDRDEFMRLLGILYERSKRQSRAGFPALSASDAQHSRTDVPFGPSSSDIQKTVAEANHDEE